MFQAVFYIYNCEDSASGNCPLFTTFRFGREFTQMLEMKNQIWSPIVQNFHPPTTYPILPVGTPMRSKNSSVHHVTAVLAFFDPPAHVTMNGGAAGQHISSPPHVSRTQLLPHVTYHSALPNPLSPWRHVVYGRALCTPKSCSAWHFVFQGKYILRNGTMDMRALQNLPIPLEKYYWRQRWEFSDPALFFCVEVGAKVLRSLS